VSARAVDHHRPAAAGVVSLQQEQSLLRLDGDDRALALPVARVQALAREVDVRRPGQVDLRGRDFGADRGAGAGRSQPASSSAAISALVRCIAPLLPGA